MRTPLSWQRHLVGLLLDDPAVLDEGPASSIETHFSWVILTRRYAFKLKKALAEPWLHHDTPRDRRLACQSEVHLNRRLGADVYLDVIGIGVAGDRTFRLTSDAGADEYLVKMIRLDERHNLSWQIRHGRVDPASLDGLVDKLANFYRRSPPEWLPPAKTWRGMEHQISEQIEALGQHSVQPAGVSLEALGAALQRLGRALRELLEERIRTGHIREVHGDLRPEHVYFTPEPVVIDCLEFSRPLRLKDPVEEIAFLAMECERMGAVEAARRLRVRFNKTTGESPPAGLWHFYVARRALLWAVLAIRHQDRPDSRGDNDWRARASAYLCLVEHHLGRLAPARKAR